MKMNGIEDPKFDNLSLLIQIAMPPFFENMKDEFDELINNTFSEDCKNNFYPAKKLEERLEEGKDVRSNFPEDTFRFIESQLIIITENKLKGNNYIKIIEVIILLFLLI